MIREKVLKTLVVAVALFLLTSSSAAVQHGIRDCHGLSSRCGHCNRPGQRPAGRQTGPARRRLVYRGHGRVFSLESNNLKITKNNYQISNKSQLPKLQIQNGQSGNGNSVKH